MILVVLNIYNMQVNPCQVNRLNKLTYIVCLQMGICSSYFCLEMGLNRVWKGVGVPGTWQHTPTLFDSKCPRTHSILLKSISERYRSPVGPITARYKFKQNANRGNSPATGKCTLDITI